MELFVLLVPVSPVGGFGTAFVVTELEATDGTDVPWAAVAVTVNVYAVLAESPVTRIGEDAPVAVTLPGELVTV